MSTSTACCGQLVKILIASEPNWDIWFKCCIHTSFKYSPAIGMQNGDEGLPSIISVGRGILVKMLILLEPRGIF